MLDPDGRPVPGATVEFSRPDQAPRILSCDAAGRFQLAGELRGSTCVARASGFAPSLVQRAWGEDLELHLRRWAALEIQVRARDGAPAGVDGLLTQAGRVSQATGDARGHLVFSEVLPESGRLRVEAPGFAPRELEVRPGSGIHVVELAVAASLRGRVRPTGPAELVAFANGEQVAQAEADAQGNYLFPALPAGDLEVQARDSAGRRAYAATTLAPHQEGALDLELRAGVRVHGEVRSAEGVPVEGLVLLLRSVAAEKHRSDPQLVPCPSGSFLAEAVAPGRYVLEVYRASRIGKLEGGALLACPLEVATVDLRQDMTLPAQSFLTGHGVDARGAPLAGAQVLVFRGARFVGRTVTDAQGAFSLPGLERAPHRVLLRGRDDRAVAVAELTPGPRARLIAGPPASWRGRLLDASGEPVAQASLRLDGLDGAVARLGRTDANGHFSFEGLFAGSYALQRDGVVLGRSALEAGTEHRHDVREP